VGGKGPPICGEGTRDRVSRRKDDSSEGGKDVIFLEDILEVKRQYSRRNLISVDKQKTFSSKEGESQQGEGEKRKGVTLITSRESKDHL